MKLPFPLRVTLALGVVLGLFVAIVVVLLFTETAFNVWDRLQRAPAWFFYVYLAGIGLISFGAGWVIWRLMGAGTRKKPKPEPEAPAVPDREQVERRVRKAEEAGMDVTRARRELAMLQERQAVGRVHISLFGEISSGKSSLIRALLPDAEVEISVRGGTTRAVRDYRWISPAGDELVLTDMPGLDEVGAGLDFVAREEALRSHLVIYVCDSDLTRSQHDELQDLLAIGKPCILALNKIDRYTTDELAMIQGRLGERLAEGSDVQVVGVRAGGTQEVVRVLADGTEEIVTRELKPDVGELQRTIQRYVDRDPEMLNSLRDSAVFVLVSHRLDKVEADHKREQAKRIVTSYSRKAVIGAMAAVTPGSDIIIQGFLGVRMIRALSELYDVSVRKVDTDLLLELVQKHVGRTTTLVLAVAGNALKAFPGMGTLAGGVMHAVAYGMIFETLGNAVATSLDTRGDLHPAQTAKVFKETLGEDLEASAKRFAKLALAQKKDAGD